MLRIPFITGDRKTDANFRSIQMWAHGVFRSANSPPDTGRHLRGEIVWDNSPSPEGYIGWVCVVSGEPGTWKGFGQIDS